MLCLGIGNGLKRSSLAITNDKTRYCKQLTGVPLFVFLYFQVSYA